MPAYIISRVKIRDLDAMSAYMAKAPDTVKAHGGTYLVRSNDFSTLEGETDYDRVVVLEFPDKEKAMAWYNSDDYAPLREQRWASADAQIIVV